MRLRWSPPLIQILICNRMGMSSLTCSSRPTTPLRNTHLHVVILIVFRPPQQAYWIHRVSSLPQPEHTPTFLSFLLSSPMVLAPRLQQPSAQTVSMPHLYRNAPPTADPPPSARRTQNHRHLRRQKARSTSLRRLRRQCRVRRRRRCKGWVWMGSSGERWG